MYLALECPDGYTELVSGSGKCYKIVEDTIDGNKMSWEKANDNCKNENAMLACFDNTDEARILAQHCHDVNNGYGCWVGYQYNHGKSVTF